MVMRNPELVSHPLKVHSASQTLEMLKYFTFCDHARQELTGYLRLLVWGARILEAQSCVRYLYYFHKNYHLLNWNFDSYSMGVIFQMLGTKYGSYKKFQTKNYILVKFWDYIFCCCNIIIWKFWAFWPTFKIQDHLLIVIWKYIFLNGSSAILFFRRF